MSDLLYYYCGGNRHAVMELAVSAASLLHANPKRSYRIGVGLDRESAGHLDLKDFQRTPGVTVKILDDQLPLRPEQEPHTLHVINRWRCLQLFDYERALILDIDTIVNRPLDELFQLIHSDPEYFTTFAHFSNRDRRWTKHQAYYDACGDPYPQRPLYCSIGLHAVRRGWPHIEEVMRYCRAMDAYKRTRRRRRAFVEEYSISLVLLRNGGKVHFPSSAIRKGRGAADPSAEIPHVWHYILGRSGRDPRWLSAQRAVLENGFWGLRPVSQSAEPAASSSPAREAP